MLGSNYTAAKFSNIDTNHYFERILLVSFSAITAIIMRQLNSVKANYAESYLLVAILLAFRWCRPFWRSWEGFWHGRFGGYSASYFQWSQFVTYDPFSLELCGFYHCLFLP